MPRKSSSKKQTQETERETISLNSVDNLHGHVDFFGIETRRVNKRTHRKLKVIQTWIFIQGVVLILLVAYLIVATVWLAPFVPIMNTVESFVDRSPAFRAAQAQVQNAQDSLVNVIEDIERVRQWTARSDNDTSKTAATLNEHDGSIADLAKALKEAITRVGVLEGLLLGAAEVEGVIDTISKHKDDIADMLTCCSESEKRLHDLECFQEATGPALEKLENFTKKNLDALANRSNQLSDTVTGLNTGVNACHSKCDSAGTNFEEKLSREVERLEKEDAIVYQKLCELEGNTTDWTNDHQNALHDLLANVTCLSKTASDLADKQKKNLGWVKKKLTTERLFTSDAINTLARALQGKTAELQCSIDQAGTNFSSAIYDLRNDTEAQLEGLQCAIGGVNSSLNSEIQTLQRNLRGEKGRIKAQFSQLNGQISILNGSVDEILNSNVIGDFKILQTDYATFKPHIIETAENVKTDLYDLKNDISLTNKTHNAQFLNLKNQTCELDNTVREMVGANALRDQRMSNAEKTRQNADAATQKYRQDMATQMNTERASITQRHAELEARVTATENKAGDCCASVAVTDGLADEYYGQDQE